MIGRPRRRRQNLPKYIVFVCFLSSVMISAFVLSIHTHSHFRSFYEHQVDVNELKIWYNVCSIEWLTLKYCFTFTYIHLQQTIQISCFHVKIMKTKQKGENLPMFWQHESPTAQKATSTPRTKFLKTITILNIKLNGWHYVLTNESEGFFKIFACISSLIRSV